MGDKDKVKALRNENDQLKRQLEALKKKFGTLLGDVCEMDS